ncbi:hypothetical protein KKI24_07965 [bacterium]|nr:hypothetical protein [bacterium]
MDHFLEKIPGFLSVIEGCRDTMITNIVLIGEKAAPTFKEGERVKTFVNRLITSGVDECTFDSIQNPIGIIRGKGEKPPILLVAHLDTFVDQIEDFNYTIKKNMISGPGVSDNSVGVGTLASLPQLLRKLNLQFESDILLAGVIQSIGKGNLRGIRHLLKSWSDPVRGAVCIEGVELGRLNYFSEGMIRAEIDCISSLKGEFDRYNHPNAILVINEVINRMLEIRLPKKPRSKVVIGRVSGGVNHGKNAETANIGFEIRSDSDEIVKEIYRDVEDIIENFRHIYHVDLNIKTISNLNAAHLRFNHPLVKSSYRVIRALGLEPVVRSSESELSILLSHQIPAVTLGMTHSAKTDPESNVEIKPLFKGIAQLVGVLMAIDQGVCDEP